MLRSLAARVSGCAAAEVTGIIRPDGELALVYERSLAMRVAAAHFSHGAI